MVPQEYINVDTADKDSMLRTPQLLKFIRMTKFLRFLRILKLLRIVKLKQMMGRIEEMIDSEQIMAYSNMIKVVSFVLFIGHWLACIFFAIGTIECEFDECWIRIFNIEKLDSWE